jgi:hypothetical protein
MLKQATSALGFAPQRRGIHRQAEESRNHLAGCSAAPNIFTAGHAIQTAQAENDIESLVPAKTSMKVQ